MYNRRPCLSLVKNMKSEQKKFSIRVTADMPLMEFLEKRLEGYSHTAIKSLIKHRQLMLNGQILLTRHDYQLHKGDAVDVLSASQSTRAGLNHPKLSIMFEDEYLYYYYYLCENI